MLSTLIVFTCNNWNVAVNPYKPGVLFVGRRQTVQTKIRRRRPWRLIRVSNVCLQCPIDKDGENPFDINGLTYITGLNIM